MELVAMRPRSRGKLLVMWSIVDLVAARVLAGAAVSVSGVSVSFGFGR